MKLKENLKKYRTQAGYTLQEVADILGISRSTLFKYESGDIPNIPIENIIKLAEIYKTDPNKLIGWDILHKHTYNNDILYLDIKYLTDCFSKTKDLAKTVQTQEDLKDFEETSETIIYLYDILCDYLKREKSLIIDKKKLKLTNNQIFKQTNKQQELLSNFSKLNELGQNKILEDIADLTELPKYQKDPDN